MKKYILHCHVSGEFWEACSVQEISRIVEAKMSDGADIDDFSVYSARQLMMLSVDKTITGVNICEATANPGIEC